MQTFSTTCPPLRVALCITELEVGGAERCLVELAKGLDRARFEVEVYSMAAEPPPRSPSLVPELREAGVPVHFLGASGVLDALPTVRRLAAKFREQRPDIVQTFLFHANIVGRLAARKAGAPHTISGVRVAERRSGWYLRLDRWTEKNVDVHVCVSQSVAEFSRIVGGLSPERLVVIPNGVDVGRFDAARPVDLAKLGVPEGRRVVTYVGRLDAQKGLIWLLENSRAWMDRLPEHDLLVVGRGPERAAMEREVERAGIGDRVHFAGWRPDVPGTLRSSSLLVLPSIWEGMPNVVLEAMACRLPVVATDVEGVRELLGPMAHAQLAPRDNAAEFVEKLVALGARGEWASRVGADNRRRVEDHFSLPAMVDQYARLYQRIAGHAC